jgi:NTP pyrophosphatase (non-canonical NTP hydrolase)
MSETLFISINNWQRETFPTATALSKAKHLAEEALELVKAIEENEPLTEEGRLQIREEMADVFILLLGVTGSLGLNYRSLLRSVRTKMSKNRRRVWHKPDADGVQRHVKEIHPKEAARINQEKDDRKKRVEILSNQLKRLVKVTTRLKELGPLSPARAIRLSSIAIRLHCEIYRITTQPIPRYPLAQKEHSGGTVVDYISKNIGTITGKQFDVLMEARKKELISPPGQWFPISGPCPYKYERIEIFSAHYPKGDPMRIRIIDSQFLETTKDASHWRRITEPI